MAVTVNSWEIHKSPNVQTDRSIYVTCDIDIDGASSIRYEKNHYVVPDDVDLTAAAVKAWLKQHFRNMIAAERERVAAAANDPDPDTAETTTWTLAAADLNN